MELPSSSLPAEGGIVESVPHSPQIPFPQECQWESIYIYWKEMVFLKFYIRYILAKVHGSGLTVKCHGLCLFLTCSLLLFSPPASPPLPSHHASVRTHHALRSWWFVQHSVTHRQQQRGRANLKAAGAGCGLGATDP